MLKEEPNNNYQKPITPAQKFRRKVFTMIYKEEEKVRAEKGKVTLSDMKNNKKYQALNRVLAIIH